MPTNTPTTRLRSTLQAIGLDCLKSAPETFAEIQAALGDLEQLELDRAALLDSFLSVADSAARSGVPYNQMVEALQRQATEALVRAGSGAPILPGLCGWELHKDDLLDPEDAELLIEGPVWIQKDGADRVRVAYSQGSGPYCKAAIFTPSGLTVWSAKVGKEDGWVELDETLFQPGVRAYIEEVWIQLWRDGETDGRGQDV